MSDWDAVRQATKGRVAPIPRCSRCTRPRVFNPCRDCGTVGELVAQGAPMPGPPPISRITIPDLPVINAPELPPRFADQSPVESILDRLRATKETAP